ncbi:MAG TPA: ABC transporter permease [Candidatus Methylacidiphilales bacterium]|jgi:lipoprotein-releasing system permease protein|nr:ABC transporter permease [Candidatus Methylacidiphilales bacterium]
MQLPVELFLALRYLRPRRTFVSVITVLSFLGVTVGVGALIVVLSVMAGFQQEITNKIIGFNAHITVAPADGGVLYDYDKLTALLQKQPGVRAASPFIRGPVLVEHQDARGATNMTPAYIKSVPENGDDPVLPLKKYLIMGDWELRGDSVIVGKEWSRRNGAFPGDKITIYGAAQVQSFLHRNDKNAVIALPEEPIIRGVFETGQSSYDLDYLLVSTEMAQKIWGMNDAVHAIAVRVDDPAQAGEIKDRLNQILPPTLHARTWMDDNRDLFNQIEVERVVMAVILCLILIVAAFGLCSTLITTTIQKSREIGLMKALGANDLQVCGVFLLHGTVVGVVGTIGGTLVGLLVLRNLNHIRDFILYAFHIEVFSTSVYGLPEIPAIVNPPQILIIDIAALLICVFAALIPALSAAALAPARALRYE